MKQHYRFRAYVHLLRIHQPIGSLLLLWPTLWALWLAGNGHPSLKLVILFTLGTFLMRGLGCVINDIADRNFDGFVTRTKKRPLATGALALKDALILLIFLCFVALCLVLQFNRLTIELSIIGLALALIYPYTKRFTYWPQWVLGLAFSWGIPMAFAAEMNAVPLVAWLLFISASLWPLAYDTMYAMVDREDDKRIGIKSTALFWGHKETLFIGVIQSSFVALLACLGVLLKLHFVFYLALGFASSLLIYQHYLIKDRKPENCFKAFLNNNWVGALLFLGFLLGIHPL
ncbi:MAG: 4-hydroxybenzoate octaprenyltransferase [Rickettsiella sp.]|nr:4-hydroxybenzoate octaprenyltransferase [Rickettsiella sp.]